MCKSKYIAGVLALFAITSVQPFAIERRGNRPNSSRSGKEKNSNKKWYNRRRNQGVKVQRRGQKPPRWEKEGDSLYREIVQDNPYRKDNEKMTYERAKELTDEVLKKNKGPTNSSPSDHSKFYSNSTLPEKNKRTPEPPFSWGGLSVGPVWKQRLLKNGYDTPTPIQTKTFSAISTGNENLIIASATGSGKSLAYLLPLLTTSGEPTKGEYNAIGRVWIVTPTTELASQLQRVVANLVGDESSNGNIRVLKRESDDEKANHLQTLDSQSYMIAGTPGSFRQLLRDMKRPQSDESLKRKARALTRNLQTLVMDEADRLLQTEAFARKLQYRREDQAVGSPNRRPVRSKPPGLDLLETLANNPVYSTRGKRLRVICASATVGRTLRRQLMMSLGTTSMDKAAALITEEVRTKKDATARLASLMPTTLQHSFHLLPDCTDEELVDAMTALMANQLDPAPALVFPGRIGVEAVQESLRSGGFNNVMGLENVDQLSVLCKSPTEGYPSWQSTPILIVSEKLGRGLDIPDLGYVVMLQVPSSAAGYTHLAGRTGRNGKKGTALTICRPREVPKLLVIGDTLDLAFQDMSEES